ncbi:MAG: hypothetical protein M1457_00755 [bacterium]|nr:hypothetical protein [bacterium]
MKRLTIYLSALALLASIAAGAAQEAMPDQPPTDVRVREFKLEQPFPADMAHGGLFAHDLTDDGRLDFVVTSEGHLGAYDHSGAKLWIRQAPIKLFNYTHHPSAIVADFDGDGAAEVACLTPTNEIQIYDGRTGEPLRTLKKLGEPIAMAIANLRGHGDREIVLQYDLTHLRAISAEDGSTVWETNEYKAIEHSPLRLADLDGDGRDEVAGAAMIDHDGKLMHQWVLDGRHQSMDSIAIGDVIPGGPLEVVLAEQRGANSHTDMVNSEAIVWRALNPWNWEDPDKVVIGDFDPERPGLEIYNRSSGGDGVVPRTKEEPFRYELGPWVLDAQGEVIAKYYLNDHKPAWWTGHGIEEIHRIDWDGGARDYLAAKERHRSGAAAIVDALTGEFRVILPARALRVYAADLEGDAREEVAVIDEAGTIKIFINAAPNPHPPKPSPWTRQPYRRQKQNWDYYSP